MLLRSTCIPRPPLARPHLFARDEEGAATIVGLIFFAMMIIAGGFAMDLMRSENDRASLQYAMDRATLAAAALDQERDPKKVVEDYLRAAGYPADAVRIQTFKTEEEARITVRGNSEVESLFMHVIGDETIEAPVWSQAREEEVRVEVSLILDISGSMGSSVGDPNDSTKSRNDAMRESAKDFVFKLINGAEDLTSVSVVPYNHTVNLGATLGPYFTLTDEHNESNCVVFDTSDFNTTNIASGTVLTRMGNFDFQNGENPAGPTKKPHCPTNGYAEILPWSNDIDALQAHIDTLDDDGWTAIDLGVKWGTVLLDPSMRAAHSSLIASGDVDSEFAGRPFDYDEPRVKKVLVVMTDGKNTTQRDLKDYAKNGPTGIFVYNPTEDISVPTEPVSATATATATATSALTTISPVSNWSSAWTSRRTEIGLSDRTGWWASADRGTRGLWTAWDRDNNDSGSAWYTETYFSVWSEEEGRFYLPHKRQYADEPEGGVLAAEISWQELHAAVGNKWIKNKLLKHWDEDAVDEDGEAIVWDENDDDIEDVEVDNATRNYFKNTIKTNFNQSGADTNLSNICQAAGDAGIIIFTIAFQAPSDGQTALQDCAGRGREGYHHDAKGAEDLTGAFDSILASINLLKLTQ